ncbi:hypothetical protein MCEMSHM24_02424 [Comamonadaceae bacterium]
MFAQSTPSIKNEPLLARHARWVHSVCGKYFRQWFMRGFNQTHAVEILTPAHVRRSMDVAQIGGADLTRQLAMEDMRRSIHNVYVGRASTVLVCAAIVMVAGTLAAYGLVWNDLAKWKQFYVSERFGTAVAPTSPVDKAKAVLVEQKGRLARFQQYRKEKAAAEAPQGGASSETAQPTRTEEVVEKLSAWARIKAAIWKDKAKQIQNDYRKANDLPEKNGLNDAAPTVLFASASTQDGVQIDPNRLQDAQQKIYDKAQELARKRGENIQKWIKRFQDNPPPSPMPAPHPQKGQGQSSVSVQTDFA